MGPSRRRHGAPENRRDTLKHRTVNDMTPKNKNITLAASGVALLIASATGHYLMLNEKQISGPVGFFRLIADTCQTRMTGKRTLVDTSRCPIPPGEIGTTDAIWGGKVTVATEKEGKTYIIYDQLPESECMQTTLAILNHPAALYIWRNNMVLTKDTPENDIQEACTGNYDTTVAIR